MKTMPWSFKGAGLLSGLIWGMVGTGCGGPNGLTFYLPFDDGPRAVMAKGDPEPIGSSKPGALVEGLRGKGMRLNKDTRLMYRIAGNYRNAGGSLAMWFRFLQAEPGEAHHLFYEKGDEDTDPDLPARIFTLAGGEEIFHVFPNPQGYWSRGRFDLQSLLGGWHQLVYTWDKDIGERLYLDGVFLPRYGGGVMLAVLNYKRPEQSHKNLTIGLRGSNAELLVDEVKIYDRMLTEKEIRDAYQEVFPLQMHAAPLLFRTGRPVEIRVALENIGAQPATGTLKYDLRDEAGALVREGCGREIKLDPRQKATVSFDAEFPRLGEYLLTYTFTGKINMIGTTRLYAIPPAKKYAVPQDDRELNLELVREIDCTKTYGPGEYCDDGTSRVVSSALGEYRATGATPWSRFAYYFEVPEPAVPYLAVIEYPDDQARIMEIMIDNKSNRLYQTLENGLIMGDEFPNSQAMKTVRYLFYPPDKDCAIQIMNWPVSTGGVTSSDKSHFKDAPPAAARRIKIYKIIGGLPAARLANLPPPQLQRLVGYEEEDTSLTRNLGANLINDKADFRSVYLALQRRLEYMTFVGQNVLAYPLVHYTGALYPSAVMQRSVARAPGHPDFWVEMALALCQDYEVRFFPSFCLQVNPELGKIASEGPDEDGILKGADTIRQIAWNGEVSPLSYSHTVAYDILHPAVQNAVLAVVGDILDQYGNYPALGGLNFWLWSSMALWFQDLHWGYGDRAMTMFESDTGVKVPGQAPDPERFVKRYMFLVKGGQAVREKWIAWRCGKVKDLWMKIYRRVQAKNPNLLVTIETWAIPPWDAKDYWTPGNTNDVYNFYREGGLDLNLYRDIPHLNIGKVFYHNLRPKDEDYLMRDFEFSPAFILPFRNQGRNSVWLEQERREFDQLKHAGAMPGYWWPEYAQEKSGGIVPHGDFYLEGYANALANFDATLLTDGGIVITSLGHENELRDFIKAYRTLPATYFEVFKGVDDPLCVRHAACPEGYYFYLVNREFYPVTVTLDFNRQTRFSILNLAENKPVAIDNGRLSWSVGPFRVVSFKAAADISLRDAKVEAPTEILAGLNRQVAAFRESVDRLYQKGDLDPESKDQIEWAKNSIAEAYAQRRWSWLRHLLAGFQVRKVNRLLTDRDLASFLTVPKPFLDRFYGPLAIRVGKVDAIPPIDSNVWEKAPAIDNLAEIKLIEGKFRPRPGKEKTTVSFLYHNAALGILFQCYDGNIGKVKAKTVDRDGAITGADDDCLEIFLSHQKDNKPYYHFMFNFGQSRKDHRGFTDAGRYEDPRLYNPDWQISTRKAAGKWLARVVIPFKSLDNAQIPKRGDTWGVNLGRMIRDESYTCLKSKIADTGDAGGVHCPDRFAVLEFD